MDSRHSSPASRPSPSRSGSYRDRKSCPLIDLFGISTPEAELIMAEGRAARQTRYASRQRRAQGNLSDGDHSLGGTTTTFRPKDHASYLKPRHDSRGSLSNESTSQEPRRSQHARILSDATDRSASTITGPVTPSNPSDLHSSSALSSTSPIGDYSANLAKFIKSQLSSIASYHPRSCPDLLSQTRSPPLSPTSVAKRVEAPSIIAIPPVRPPLRSAFSAWSSTDDELDNDMDDDDLPSIPALETPLKGPKLTGTPSILQYYENASNASFLFSCTPPVENSRSEHPNAKAFSFPRPPASPEQVPGPAASQCETDFPSSSSPSSRPLLSSSSAPSSISASSYFDCKRPLSLAPHLRERIIAAVSPQGAKPKVLTAISPFEAGALASVHQVFVYEAQHRVRVDGLSFDLMDRHMSEVAPRVPTPC